MNCSDVRFALAADPSDVPADVAGHLDSCPSCAAYAQDMLLLDDRLRSAMNVSVPAIPLPNATRAVVTALPRRNALQRFALAASVAGVAVLVGLLWIGVPRQSLASAVVGHMAHEPAAWTQTETLPADAVAQVLAQSGVKLRDGMPDVSYASSCWFRGRHVPHLVVRTAGGPVTVMVLPQEEVAGPVAFDEGGYRGVLVPAQRGSIAVLARGAADVQAVANEALAAIEYRD